ncbi:hypothetical protein [Streptomyces sp. SP18CS02]|uniref:hypothetical protein n=1 Tax=Streptomyces sp. SP18CS02 TaxID=3002531 RepID=UPI002E78816F|nr:hypothetical protein [Streptomyces sp. SP18CS02]MEE1753069.1 hypothetical protein [Streptomyces sp. SP18CS02]
MAKIMEPDAAEPGTVKRAVDVPGESGPFDAELVEPGADVFGGKSGQRLRARAAVDADAFAGVAGGEDLLGGFLV